MEYFGEMSQEDLLVCMEMREREETGRAPRQRITKYLEPYILMGRTAGNAGTRWAIRVSVWTCQSVCWLKENLQVEVFSVSCINSSLEAGAGVTDERLVCRETPFKAGDGKGSPKGRATI